jgi:uracil-DNA glycosylase
MDCNPPYPKILHENNVERKAAIMCLFIAMETELQFDVAPTIGKLQGPVKLSRDIKEGDEVNLTEEINKMKSSRILIIEDEVPIDPSWTLHEQIVNSPPSGWEPVFKSVDQKIQTISAGLKGKYFYPRTIDVFRCFRLTPLMCVRMVILGLDPYPQENCGIPDACGLSFSYRRDFPVPGRSSLKNIFKLLKICYPNFIEPYHGDLSSWARQGVLLLNTALTVAPGTPKSHLTIWEGFTIAILKAILAANPGTVFMLWGADAQKMEKQLGNRAVVIRTSHPSGQSAYVKDGFMQSQCFIKANEKLIEQGHNPIDWCNFD